MARSFNNNGLENKNGQQKYRLIIDQAKKLAEFRRRTKERASNPANWHRRLARKAPEESSEVPIPMQGRDRSGKLKAWILENPE